MRYSDFKIVETKLTEQEQTYIIGDSHAKAMSSGPTNLAVNGARISAIVQQARRVPDGSFVYVSAGHNDVAAGTNPNVIAREVRALINGLTARDCEVVYILFPEGTSNPNQENMGPAREAIRAAGIPIGEDLEGCSLTDGQHCSVSTYTGILNNSTTTRSDRNPEGNTDGLQAGPPYPPEDIEAVRALQTKLEELGYSVGSTGIDGKYGPRTSRAVAAYMRDRNIADTERGRSIPQEQLTALASAEPVEDPSPTGNEAGGSARYDLPPLSDRTDVQGAVGEVLDFIGRYEARGLYDIRNGGSRDPDILDMTINEVLRYQNNRRSWPRSASTAIGRYQYTQGTLRWVTGLMGVNRNTQKFDEDFQDRLCIYDMRYRCKLDDWLAGRIESDEFVNELAQVWAAIPNSSNRSQYRGIAGNRRGIDYDNAVAMLDRIRQGIA
jgi:peptidoglycan hydrolase-like protein with peptidoglycan-binding domain